MKRITLTLLGIFLLTFLIVDVSAADSFFKTHGQAQTNQAGDTSERGLIIYTTNAGNLTGVTKYADAAATGVGIYFPDGTHIANATYVGNNATFTTPVPLANQTYYVICQIEQTNSAWKDPGNFPYNTIVNVTFIASQDCTSGFLNQTNVVREISGITISYGPTAPSTLTPSTTLVAPGNLTNQTRNATFIITSNSSNSSIQLVNVSLYLNGALNQTVSITGTGNITTITKIVSLNSAQNWTAVTCDTMNCSLMPGNRTFTALKVYKENEEYSANVTEGSSTTLKINVSLSSGFQITAGNLTYNNTNYSGTISQYNSTLFQISATIVANAVNTNTNVTFNWTVFLDDGTNLKTSSNNQTVVNIGVDDCSSFTNMIYNFTLLSEGTQVNLTTLTNETMEVSLNVFDTSRTIGIINFSKTYTNINPARICFSGIIQSTTFFSADLVVKYSGTNYETEYYNVLNFTLSNTSAPQNIMLFDLLTSESTEFKITFKDENFVPVENALVLIQRQYISENNTFKTVEIPKTDTNGQTVGHFVELDVVYNIIVTNGTGGQVLGTFENIIAFCADPTIGDCEINLNSFSSGASVFDYDEELGISITRPAINQSTRVLSLSFTTFDGSVRTVRMSAYKYDQLGNTTACNTTLTSASGTLSCTIPAALGNSTVQIFVYVDDILVITDFKSLNDPGYGGEGYLFTFFVVLILVVMFSESKTAMIVAAILGLIVGVGVSAIRGSVLGFGASIGFLIVVAVILIWKLNKERG